MRISDYRLSPAMKDLLVGITTGAIHRNSRNFSAATAEALYKRGLVDAEFRPSSSGRQVAADIVSRMPKQFAEPELARLIAGLQILQLYAPYARPSSAPRSRRCVELQEDVFADITAEHRTVLGDLGWEQTGPFQWIF